jgi:hypothetical protein
MGEEYKQGGNIIAGNPRIFEALAEALRKDVPEALRN